ncbi:MAG: tetratricopeptide repeat protein [Magnetovibrionaceae bacterium]
MALFRNADPKLLWRYILIGSLLTFVCYSVWGLLEVTFGSPDGAYEVRQGDIALKSADWDRAIEAFDEALALSPGHSGAAMGRAIALMQSDREEEAETAFTALIQDLSTRETTEGRTSALAIAYANRGILRDRAARHREALDDYLKSLETDAGAVEGPDLVDRLLYANPEPSTVRKRARYLYEEFQKPAAERRLSLPEMDAEQRMHRP